MEAGLLSRSSRGLEHDVREALASCPGLHRHAIVSAVEDGVVTLIGSVDSLREAVAAERAVKCVNGVRSIANSLHVKEYDAHSDTDIAREALHRLRNSIAVPLSVQVVVHDGHIRLDGVVSWDHQRAAAESAVRYLSGVRSVANDIRVTAR